MGKVQSPLCLSLFMFLGLCIQFTNHTAFAKTALVDGLAQAQNSFLPENTLHLQAPGPTSHDQR
jgi:hypothetical protein